MKGYAEAIKLLKKSIKSIEIESKEFTDIREAMKCIVTQMTTGPTIFRRGI